MYDNLATMVQASQTAKAKVLLIGMQVPPNYGETYTTKFSAVYTDLQHRYHTALVPFFLDQIALDQKLMQADNLHPNEHAQMRLLDNVWPQLRTLLQKN
jgi:acyl-CoA thioesterase-1